MGSKLDFGELLNRFAKLARAGKICREQLELLCDDMEAGGANLPKTDQSWRPPGSPKAEEPRMWYWPSEDRSAASEIEESPMRYWPAASPARPTLQPSRPPPLPALMHRAQPKPSTAWLRILGFGIGLVGLGLGVLIGLSIAYLIH